MTEVTNLFKLSALELQDVNIEVVLQFIDIIKNVKIDLEKVQEFEREFTKTIYEDDKKESFSVIQKGFLQWVK